MPRLTPCLSTTSPADSSHAEFICGVRLRARHTALATISSGETLISRNSRRCRSRSTSSMVAVTSHVVDTLTCGAVKADWTIASAIALRTPLIGTRVSPGLGSAGPTATAGSGGSIAMSARSGSSPRRTPARRRPW